MSGSSGDGDDGGRDRGDLGNVILLPGLTRPPQGATHRPPRAVVPPDSEGLERIEKPGPPADHLIEPAVESMLLAADGPITIDQLDMWLEEPGKRRLRLALYNIQTRNKRDNRGIQLVQVARGWQLRTDTRFPRWVATLRGGTLVFAEDRLL